MWIINLVLGVAVIVSIVIFIVWILRQMGLIPTRSGSMERVRSMTEGSGAIEALKERLARGEISEEEYRRLKRILEEG